LAAKTKTPRRWGSQKRVLYPALSAIKLRNAEVEAEGKRVDGRTSFQAYAESSYKGKAPWSRVDGLPLETGLYFLHAQLICKISPGFREQSGFATLEGLLRGEERLGADCDESVARVGRNRFMRQVAWFCFGVLLAGLPACFAPSMLSAQYRLPPPPVHHHVKKPDPKPEPTQEELVDYVRAKLLALTATDGYNDNVEVTFNPATTALIITRPDGRCENFLNTLDTNSMVWEIFDPSDQHVTREPLLRLTVSSKSGEVSRICYDKQNHVDTSVISNRVRLLFSTSKEGQVPDFRQNMTKAIQKLIVLCGGTEQKEIF
jgi:hypothetical protein